MNQNEFEKLLQDCNLELFKVASQSSPQDKQSLLLIQNILRNHVPGYNYLEIGSHLGGTLAPHLFDEKCRSVISVDPRPLSQPDERGRSFDYDANSTARMREMLSQHVSAGQMLKLRTFDFDMRDVGTEDVGTKVDLAFIDGEHTNVACFRDFMNVLPKMKEDCAVAFHDADLIFDALSNIEEVLKWHGRPFTSYYLPTTVHVIAFGEMRYAFEPLKAYAYDKAEYINGARLRLQASIVENAEFRQ